MTLTNAVPHRFFGFLMVALACLSLNSHAGLVHDFQLNGNAADALGGADIGTEGGVFDSTGYRFSENQGLTLNAPSVNGTYSIETRFSIGSIGDYVKLIDYSNLVDDAGMYNADGYAEFYGGDYSPDNTAFAAGQLITMLLTRNAAGTVTVYLDDIFSFDFDDSIDEMAVLASAATPLRFFQDDNYTIMKEASAGYVDYIRIYDNAILPSASVPEPSSLALLLLGLPLLRRRYGRVASRSAIV